MGLSDLRTTARRLLRAPSFALTVSGTLAIAIGAITAVFSVVYGLLLHPLPFRDPGKLVGVIDHRLIYGHEQDRLSPTDFMEWRKDLHTFNGIAGYTNYTANLTGQGEPVRISTAQVTANWFTLLGVGAEAGRVFAVGDDQPQAQRVLVLSDALWRRQFGADPHLVGSTVHIDATAYTVIGIAPRSMTLPNAPDIWLPWVFQPWQIGANARGDLVVRAIGRLATGVPIARARADVREVENRVRTQFGDTSTLFKYDVVPLRTRLVGDARPALLVLFAAVGCLLLIACANVANLLLVRAVGREHEISIRLALGARRADIVQQLVTESAILALLGGAVGVALALLGVRIAGAQTTIDATVLMFSAVVTIVAGVVAGLVPALSATNPRPTRGSQRGGRLRGALVVGEIALAMPLLIAAGLLGRSLSRLTDVDPGFRPEHAVRFEVALTVGNWDSAAFAHVRYFTDEVVRRLGAVPGTHIAGAADNVPFGSGQHLTWFDVKGRPPAPSNRPNYAQIGAATSGYFASLGIPLLRGRVFTDQDGPNGHLVVVINRALADAMFQGEDPIGKTLTTTSYVDTTGTLRTDDYGEIVGVVGNTTVSDLAGSAQQTIYTAFDQSPGPNMTYIVRSSLDPRSVLVTARAQVAAVDPTAPVFNAMPMEDAVQASVKRPRTNAWIVGGFAVVALMLASLGIFGVIAFAVRERNREIGIRLALGARGGQVVWLMITQGLALAAVGLLIGAPLSIAARRILATLVYGIKPTDTVTYALVSISLMIVAMTASWIPASRAARVDPTIAMRV